MVDHGDQSEQVRLSGALKGLDRATEFVERPVRRVSGPSRINPVAHAGTISVFLLGVVIVTGLYITLFFEFGFAASYDSVASMEDHVIQRLLRAVHRYSSAAMVLTTLVHGWKIFTSSRFRGPRRRLRWASGIASLTFVWFAGVTGYWLIWDRRAAAISEAAAKLLQPTGFGSRFAVRNLLGVSPGSGSGLLLLIWFAHIGTTLVLVWFTYRHLRRSKQPWLPPRRWMAFMGGSLIIVSALMPVGMLGPARPDQLVADMPLDPFMLFLLPALLSEWRWFALAALVALPLLVALFPRLLRRSDPPIVQVDPEACTGCELCVIDCPFDALTMVVSGAAEVAALDANQCVGCGICVGSCAFGAIDFVPSNQHESPSPSPEDNDLSGREVVVICDRHDLDDVRADDAEVVAVRCAGMFAPNATRGYIERGATSVHLIGCAPAECRYGTGNTLTAERLARTRAPHPPRRFSDRIAADYVASDQVGWVRENPATTSATEPNDNRAYATVAAMVLASVAAIVALTSTPFRSGEGARVRVVVDHQAGESLLEYDHALGLVERVELIVDGQTLGIRKIAHDDASSTGFIDWDLPAGKVDIEVVALTSSEAKTVVSAPFELTDRGQLVLSMTDVPPEPGSRDGRDVFRSRSAGCTVCHATSEGRDGVGPTLYGVASVSGQRVEGLSAELYLRQSILLPDQYIVEGWPAGQMLPIYRERLDEQQLQALLAYLLTLTDESGS